MAAEFVFVAVLGLLAIFLMLAIWGAASELRAGMGVRREVIGFMLAVLVLLLLGAFAYSKIFDRTGPSSSQPSPSFEDVRSRYASHPGVPSHGDTAFTFWSETHERLR